MFNKIDTELQANTTPIRIYVENVASAGVDANTLISRGVCVLGLVLALQATRPVELHAFSITDGANNGTACGTSIRIETAPFDFDRATFMLCDPGFYRSAQYAASFLLGGCPDMRHSLPWPWHRNPQYDGENYRNSLRAMLKANPQDVLLPGIFLTDTRYQKDPIGWIKAELQKIKESAF